MNSSKMNYSTWYKVIPNEGLHSYISTLLNKLFARKEQI